MIIMVCVDDNNGMMFNKRRQSQDRVLRQRMLELAGEKKLWHIWWESMILRASARCGPRQRRRCGLSTAWISQSRMI